MTYAAKAAEYKKEKVSDFTELMKDYPVIGLVDISNLPSRQLQVLRKKLRKDALLLVGKTQFIRMAIDNVKASKADFVKLSESIEGMPALLFTKQNPFRIAALIKASKSKAPAKPGQVAPYDLVIPAGPTPFTPGPIISELGSLKLKTGVENGKVTIREASTIVMKGEVVSKKASEILAKFGIEPMQIGLELVAAYEDGIVYGKGVLSVDAEQYLSMIKTAAAEALGLSIETGYTTKDNIERFIAKAYRTAKNFAISRNILSDVLLEKEFVDAFRAAKSIAESANAGAATTAVSSVAVAIAQQQPEEKHEAKPEEKKRERATEEKGTEKAADDKKETAKKEAGGDVKMVAEEKKPKTMADKISEEFKDEILAEKKLRESIDAQATEELVSKLKKKGTLRQ